jgi:hypothetical protein
MRINSLAAWLIPIIVSIEANINSKGNGGIKNLGEYYIDSPNTS